MSSIFSRTPMYTCTVHKNTLGASTGNSESTEVMIKKNKRLLERDKRQKNNNCDVDCGGERLNPRRQAQQREIIAR